MKAKTIPSLQTVLVLVFVMIINIFFSSTLSGKIYVQHKGMYGKRWNRIGIWGKRKPQKNFDLFTTKIMSIGEQFLGL